MKQEHTLILRCREAGRVRRVHTLTTNTYYDVAQHTYNMQLLLHFLHPQPSACLMQAVLFHDVHERWTGDVPAGLRYFHPDVRKNFKQAERETNEKLNIPMPPLAEDDRDWLTALDQIEFWLWCHDEVNLGNAHARPYLQSMSEWFYVNKEEIPRECREFVEKFRWHRTSQEI